MKAYFSILRPLNCAMAGFAVIIGAKLGNPDFISIPVFLAVLAAALICGAGNAVNDYFDYDIDIVNNPRRPLPSGKIERERAHNYSKALFILGSLLSILINLPAFLLALFNSALLYLYAKTIKRRGGIGKNLTVSYLVASPFLFGGIAVGDPAVTLFLVFIAFLVNTSREIVKDIEDYEGDSEHLDSLPVKFGFRISSMMAAIFMASGVVLSPLPFKMGMVSQIYLVFMLFFDVLLLYSGYQLLKEPRNNSTTVQKKIKFSMILALLGFFIGTL